MTIRQLCPAMTAVAVISAACLSQTLPPTASAGSVAATPAVRLQSVGEVASDLPIEIETLIGRPSEWPLALPPADRVQLRALYQRHGYRPLWTDPLARPTPQARDALALLEAAADEGLDPADYAAAALTAPATAPGGSSSTDLARFDVGMSAGLLRYLRHLHVGRIDPGAIGFRLRTPADDHDYASLLDAALGTGRIVETAKALRPQLWAYDTLRSALEQYRTLAADPSLTAPPPPPDTVHVGDPYAGTPALRRPTGKG